MLLWILIASEFTEMLKMRLINLIQKHSARSPVTDALPLATNWHLWGNPPRHTPQSISSHMHTCGTLRNGSTSFAGLGGGVFGWGVGTLKASLPDCEKVGGQYKCEACPTLADSVGNQVVFLTSLLMERSVLCGSRPLHHMETAL